MQYLPYIGVTLAVVIWWWFNRKNPKIQEVGSRSYFYALLGAFALFFFILFLTYLNTSQYLSVTDFFRSFYSSKDIFNQFLKFSSIWVIALALEPLIRLIFKRKMRG